MRPRNAVFLLGPILGILSLCFLPVYYVIEEDVISQLNNGPLNATISLNNSVVENDSDTDDGDYYSSMYCVGHRLKDPLGVNFSSTADSDDKAIQYVIVNGVVLPNNHYNRDAEDAEKESVMANYYFAVHNRTCLYNHVYYNRERKQFYFFMRNTLRHRQLLAEKKLNLPPVSIGSRPLELPQMAMKKIHRKSLWAFSFRPEIVLGKRPRDSAGDVKAFFEGKEKSEAKHEHTPISAPYNDYIIAYFVPTVAPWNFAHTLLCDLFGFFWGYVELDHAFSKTFPAAMEYLKKQLFDLQPIATSFMNYRRFRLPNANKAFRFFSRRPPCYDVALPSGVYRGLLAGTGTKTWSWVTTDYSASGSPALWHAFRQFIIHLSGAQQPVERRDSSLSKPKRTLRVSICNKKRGRGIANADELISALRERFNRARGAFGNVEFVLETIVGKSVRRQVEMMLATDVLVCNEGTLATVFFLMNPGAVLILIPLVYHLPHLYRDHMPSPDKWWRMPDYVRGDPRFNAGGNIDWFPPAIPWVRVAWYDEIRLDEVKIQQPLGGLRNYMPNYNINLNHQRFIELMERALAFVRAEGVLWNVEPCHSNSLSTKMGMTKIKNETFDVFSKKMSAQPSPDTFDLQSAFVSLCIVPVNNIADTRNTTLRRILYMHENQAERTRFIGRTHRPPNYSITADQCRRLLHLRPSLAASFNTARCRYGMSWLCEYFANGRLLWRPLHGKWQQSGGWCGSAESWPGYWRAKPQALRSEVLKKARGASHDLGEPKDYFFDVRETRNMSHFTFFSKEELEKGYEDLTFNPLDMPDVALMHKIFG